MLGSLIQANVAERQQLLQGLAGFGQRRKAKLIRELGAKFIQQGDYTPEGVQKFAQENNLDNESGTELMMELIKVVKQFQSIQPEKEKEPKQKLYRTVKGLLPTEEAKGLMPWSKPVAPRAGPRPLTPLEREGKELDIKLKKKKLALLGTPKAPDLNKDEREILNEVQDLYEVSDLEKVDPETRTKIIRAADKAFDFRKGGMGKIKSIRKAVEEIDIEYKESLEAEETITTLDNIPTANKGIVFNNITETRTAIGDALGYSDDETIINELINKGWTPEEINQNFGDLLTVPEAEAFEPARTAGTLPEGLSEEDVEYNMKKYGKTREEVIKAYSTRKGK